MLITSKIIVMIGALFYVLMTIRMINHFRKKDTSVSMESLYHKLDKALKKANKKVFDDKDIKKMKTMYGIKLLILIMMSISPLFIAVAIHNSIAPDGYYTLEYNTQAIQMLPLLFLCIGLIGFGIYPMKTTGFQLPLYLKYIGGKNIIEEDRILALQNDRKMVHKFGFWVFILTFPFYWIGFFSYGYYNETELIQRDYLQFKEAVFIYDDLVEVKRGFEDFRGKTTQAKYTLYNDEGQHFNLLSGSGFFKQALMIHEYIEEKRPDLFEPVYITAKNNAFIKEKTAPVQAQLYDLMD